MGRNRKRGRKLWRRLHKWPSIFLSLFLLVFVVSGIVMNHRSLFSGVDVSRDYLLKEYSYQNWNDAAVKSACPVGSDSILIYGNIGVWLTDSSFTDFVDFNKGFPDGIDNRKVFKIMRTESGQVLAGTLFGLYRYDPSEKAWKPVAFPGEEKQVVDIFMANGNIYLMTRSVLFSMREEEQGFSFESIVLPPPVGYRNKASLFKTLWVIHSGEIAGFAGKLFVDLIGLLFSFLLITGIIYWLFPRWIKRRKGLSKEITRLKGINLFSLKWHNRIGIWVVVFLIITVLTGMFLRPPLLIAIATSSVKKIPFTLLDEPNPWYDKLRRIAYDSYSNAFIVGTNSGLYYAEPTFTHDLLPFEVQPPVSVMGINVLEVVGPGRFLVGSFSGLYLWNPFEGWMVDYLAPDQKVSVNPAGPPIGNDMTAGYIKLGNGKEYVFDYNRGAESESGALPFPAMPVEILKQSPMSLWNLALEFHTARYYSFLFGNLYILFIPLFGLSMLLILLSGAWLWWKMHRRNLLARK